MSYLDDVVKKLVDAGVRVESAFGDDLTGEEAGYEIRERLQYVPEENLARMLSVPVAPRVKYSDWIKEIGSFRLLKFDPYIVNENKHPSLVLRYNRFLHWFRGYHFQVSYSESGIGEWSSASTRLDVLRREFLKIGIDPDSTDLYQMLFYMNCIAAATEIDQFRELLKSNQGLVDRFVEASAKLEGMHNYGITHSRLVECITEETGVSKYILEDPTVWVYRLAASNTTDYCRLVVRDFLDISIEVPTEIGIKTFRLNLHEYIPAIDDCGDELEDTAALIHCNEILYSTVSFLLNTFGFVVNFMVAYPIEKGETMPALNSGCVMELESLNSL